MVFVFLQYHGVLFFITKALHAAIKSIKLTEQKKPKILIYNNRLQLIIPRPQNNAKTIKEMAKTLNEYKTILITMSTFCPLVLNFGKPADYFQRLRITNYYEIWKNLFPNSGPGKIPV